jgi:hypothetical protein
MHQVLLKMFASNIYPHSIYLDGSEGSHRRVHLPVQPLKVSARKPRVPYLPPLLAEGWGSCSLAHLPFSGNLPTLPNPPNTLGQLYELHLVHVHTFVNLAIPKLGLFSQVLT